MLLFLQDGGDPAHIVVIDKGQQVIPAVQGPGIRAELPDQGVNDLEHVHAVEGRMDALVALIIGGGVELAVSHDHLVIAAQDLADQEKILLQRIRKAAQPVNKIPVEAVGHVQSEPVDLKIFHPVADGIKDVPDDFLIAEIELDKVIVSFPALIPESVIIIGITMEINVEPVPVRRVLPVFYHILKLVKSPSDMVEDTVQDNADPVFMQLSADLLKILVGAQADIDLFIVPGVITVRVRLKQGTEIDCIDPQLFHMRDPLRHLPDPVQCRLFLRITFVGIGGSAESQCIDLIKHAVVSPHILISS